MTLTIVREMTPIERRALMTDRLHVHRLDLDQGHRPGPSQFKQQKHLH